MEQHKYENLNYVINKISFGLTIHNLKFLSYSYNIILENNLVDLIAEDLKNSKQDLMEEAETIHDKWAKQFPSILHVIDTTVLRLINEPQSSEIIKEEYSKNSLEFSNASNTLLNGWKNNYFGNSTLDELLNNLIDKPDNLNVKTELHLTINKARCFMGVINYADNVIESINFADQELIASKKHAMITSAKNEYQKLKKQEGFCKSTNFDPKTQIDDLFKPIVDSKIQDFNQALLMGKTIEQNLLGNITNDTE